MDASETIRAYYDALRAGEPLPPFFAEREDLVKVGITERLVGYDAVAAGLREQTAETEDWAVESRDLRVAERGSTAWFADAVAMAWTEAGERRESNALPSSRARRARERREYDSRWSGTLARQGGRGEASGRGGDRSGDDDHGEWRFVGMHVSAPH